jgi:hypothetical protein
LRDTVREAAENPEELVARFDERTEAAGVVEVEKRARRKK